MARTNNPNSATCQFFINHATTTSLDTQGGGYAVFGKVIDGHGRGRQDRQGATGTKSGIRRRSASSRFTSRASGGRPSVSRL